MKIKILLLTLCAALLFVSFCLAEETFGVHKKISGAPNEMQTITGKVKEVEICNEIKCGNKSKLVIIYDEEGSEMTFEVRTGIGISALSETKLFTLRDLKKDDIISITYIITRAGINKVQAIELKRYR